ncbi:MAG TPA: hypothetical protein PLG14_03795, partial [Spirochaetales bacterium]|nr:hypothetical protein [Spirochaetales bacterium]
LSYSDPEFELGPELKIGRETYALFSAPSLKADASAALQDGSYASGGLSLGAVLGPLGLKASMRGSASAEGAALRGGHEAALPLGPLALADRFDFDPEDGSFGKEVGLSLKAGKALGLALNGTTLWSPSAASLGSLAQSWGLKLDAGAGRFLGELKGASAARPSSPIDLDAKYFGAWAESFAYLLPAAEAEADSRSASLSLSGRLDAEREILSAMASFSGLPQAAGGALRDDAAKLRIQAPLKLKSGLALAPYYQRAWSERRGGAGSGILEGSALALGDLASAEPLWRGIPFAELFDAASVSTFGAYTGPDGAGLSKATYKPEAGVILSREYGSAWWDLLAPSALSLSYARELIRADSSLTSTQVLEWSAKSGAINLFGAFGSYPATSLFESDEYFQAVQGRFAKVEGESAIRKKLILQELATFYAKGNLDSLTVESRFSYSEEPALTEWSERLNLTLSVTRSRHWLLDL